jgi:hypothetical protein
MLTGDNVRMFDLVIQMSGVGSFDDELKHALEFATRRARFESSAAGTV